MRNDGSSIRFNLILGIFAVILAGLGALGYTSLKQELFMEQLSIGEAKTEALGSRIDRWLNTRKTEISTLANTPIVRSMDWNQSGPYLKAKHEQWPWFYIFAHINPDGTYYNSKVDFAKGQNLSDRAHFKASIAGNVYASDPVVSRTLGTDIVAVTSPIFSADSGERDIIGVFGGMIDTSTIVEELARFSNGPDSYAFAVNSRGIAIAHPDENRRGNINTKAEPLLEDSDPGLRESVATMLKGETGWLKTRIDGMDAYVIYTPINEAKWFLATVTSADFVEGQFVVVDYASALVGLVLLGGLFMVWRFRRLEFERLNAEREISEERSKAKSVFLANMSHELRTPLNGILGYAQILLAKSGQNEDARRSLEVILNSGRHLLMLINRVLDLSKIEAGRLELDPRPVNPAGLFRDLAQVFEIERAKYNARLTTQIAEDLPDVINIDPEKLTQVITNIVINAFKYGEQSEVQFSITVDRATQQLQIRVADQGKGMTEEQLERVFIPFEQASNKSDGAGLGMAIVSELLRLMNGTIKIDSKVGQGTKVQITIPYVEVESAEVSQVTAAQTLPVGIQNGRQPSVLIVDDNPQNRDFLRELLAPIGFAVTEAEDGQTALARLGEAPVELIITDLVMPNMDGFELVSKVRERHPKASLPIIVASASAFNDDQVRSLALGANDFISKPIDMFYLLRRIGELLGLQYRFGDDSAPAPKEPSKPEPRVKVEVDLDWSDRANQSLRREITEAAELAQLPKIQRILSAIEDPARKEAWMALLGPAIEQQDDELILEILGRSADA